MISKDEKGGSRLRAISDGDTWYWLRGLKIHDHDSACDTAEVSFQRVPEELGFRLLSLDQFTAVFEPEQLDLVGK